MPLGQKIQGLFGDPAFSAGIGLLGAGGPSRQPVGLGQGIGHAMQFASERDRARLRNEAMRQQISSQQRRQEAMGQLPGLLSGGNEQMEQTLGLLGDVSPEALAQTAFGQMFPQQQERSEPAPVRIARVLTDPNESEEVKSAIREQLDASGQGEQLAEQIKLLQVQQLQREQQQAQSEEERNRVDARLSVLNAGDRLKEAAMINNRLRGTLQETGFGFNELRRRASGPLAALAGVFGGDEERARQVAADVGRFEQLTTQNAVESLFSGQVGGGTLTNSKLETFLTTKPGLGQLPETNNKILADMLQANLESAQKLKVELPDRSQTEALIQQLRSDEFSVGGSPGSPKVIDFSELP